MTKLELARLQFAATIIYHFVFVPVTIGLAFLVALLQTAWHRRGDEAYLRLTKFFVSIGAVNPSLTIIANALRVGDHLLERLR